ncbi:MAG TPA: YceI family protein [Candidatus Paceibacterota bacterium]
MKKIIWIIIAVIAVAAIATFAYFLKPVSAPSQDINEVTSKLPAGSATSSVYRISQKESLVTFTMNELLRGKPFLVVGTTTQIAGDIAVKDGKFDIGELAINAKTLVTDSASRNGAIARAILKSETPGNEFMIFRPSSNDFTGALAMGKEVSFNVMGDLTISGVTKPVTFKVTATVEAGKVTGTATTTLKRSDFNLKIPDLSFIANVDDEFPVTAKIVADRVMY